MGTDHANSEKSNFAPDQLPAIAIELGSRLPPWLGTNHRGLTLRESHCAPPVSRGGKPVCCVSMVPGRGVLPARFLPAEGVEFLRRALS